MTCSVCLQMDNLECSRALLMTARALPATLHCHQRGVVTCTVSYLGPLHQRVLAHLCFRYWHTQRLTLAQFPLALTVHLSCSYPCHSLHLETALEAHNSYSRMGPHAQNGFTVALISCTCHLERSSHFFF